MTFQLVIVMTDGKSSDKYALEHAVKDLKTGISGKKLLFVFTIANQCNIILRWMCVKSVKACELKRQSWKG